MRRGPGQWTSHGQILPNWPVAVMMALSSFGASIRLSLLLHFFHHIFPIFPTDTLFQKMSFAMLEIPADMCIHLL